MLNWSPRAEILYLTQRWPLIVAVFLCGSLLGGGAALVWPAPYRATSQIYVGLDPYRAVDDRYLAAYAGNKFRNADDYKYWQMEQLNALAISDEYVEETLAQLAAQDPYWQGMTPAELRAHLRLGWRNAGEWGLTAIADTPSNASQAVAAWRAVIVTKSQQAIDASQDLFRLDLRLQAALADQLHTRLRQQLRAGATEALQEWLQVNDAAPPLETLPAREHERLLELVAQVAELAGNWQRLLADQPAVGAARQEYSEWVGESLTAISSDSRQAEARLALLESEIAALEAGWQAAYQAGHGMAATLLVEQHIQAPPAVVKLRPLGQALLVGGLLSTLAFWAWVFARPTWRK